MSFRRKAPCFIRFFLAADLALAFASLLGVVIGWGVGGRYRRLSVLIDVQAPGSLLMWYSSMQLFLIAFLLAAFARQKLDQNAKASWLLPLLPMVFAALSFEEMARLHDFVRYNINSLLPAVIVRSTPFYYTRVWTLFIGVPSALFVLAVGGCVRRHIASTRGIRVTFLLGLILFVGSGAGIETSSSVARSNAALRGLELSCWALGKLAGLTIMLWAAHDLLACHQLSPQGAAQETHAHRS